MSTRTGSEVHLLSRCGRLTQYRGQHLEAQSIIGSLRRATVVLNSLMTPPLHQLRTIGVPGTCRERCPLRKARDKNRLPSSKNTSTFDARTIPFTVSREPAIDVRPRTCGPFVARVTSSLLLKMFSVSQKKKTHRKRSRCEWQDNTH